MDIELMVLSYLGCDSGRYLSTAKPVPIRLVISRPNHRPIYQPTAHLSHITAVNHCILRPLTPADRQPNACGTADRGGGCTWRSEERRVGKECRSGWWEGE